jgi:hypothetical protein
MIDAIYHNKSTNHIHHSMYINQKPYMNVQNTIRHCLLAFRVVHVIVVALVQHRFH